MFSPGRPIALAVILAASASLPGAARADTYHPVVQLACMPEIGAFSLRNFGLYNIGRESPHMPDGEPGEVLEQVRQRHGVVAFATLAKEPWTCDLPGRRIEVRVTRYSDHAAGPCGAAERIDAVVEIDGREATRFSSDGRCPATLRHTITLTAGTGLQHCVSEFQDPTALTGPEPTPVTTLCRDLLLP
jgi:hypothetical protein